MEHSVQKYLLGSCIPWKNILSHPLYNLTHCTGNWENIPALNYPSHLIGGLSVTEHGPIYLCLSLHSFIFFCMLALKPLRKLVNHAPYSHLIHLLLTVLKIDRNIYQLSSLIVPNKGIAQRRFHSHKIL